MWDLSCPNWEQRILGAQSLIPELPLNNKLADRGLAFFDLLCLPDVPGLPLMRDACGPWFRDIVRCAFGSWFPDQNRRYIRDILAMLPKGQSKAIALDTLIATPSGFVAMADVKVGDEVIDADGKPTRVTAKSEVFVGTQCFEVEFSTGEVVVCDAEHLWVTDAHRDREHQQRHLRKTPTPSVKRTIDIANSLKVPSGEYQLNNHRTHLCRILELPPADLPIAPYAFGAWLGDGASAAAQITAGLADVDCMADRLVACGQAAYVRARYPSKGSATIYLGIPNSRISGRGIGVRAALVRMGVFNNKHIPTQYLRGSKEQRLDLLQGLMDTDGGITTEGQASFYTTNPRLRDGARELINSLGFKTNVNEWVATVNGKHCGPAWAIRFYPFDAMPVFRMPRKLARQNKRTARTASLTTHRQIVDVRPHPSVPVQCIAVASESHQYLITRSLIPTHNTTYSAGLLLTALLMNKRPRAEGLFIAPTQAIADNAYDKCVGMIEASPDLQQRFRPRDHIKTIQDLANHSALRIKTFDVTILSGTILFIALLDELHLLGRNPHTPKVLRQIRGGLEKTPEGLLIITTTQSDDIPAGAFKDELTNARRIRDGHFRGKVSRPLLPILYEFPPSIAHHRERWGDPSNWQLVMPNLGRSVQLDSLYADWQTEQSKSDQAIRIWASQHLNIEMGLGLKTDGWPGSEFWSAAVDDTLTLDSLISRSETIVIGVDGGGLDDLFGLSVLGREKTSKRWLSWSHAWCHRGVLSRRLSIASRLEDFAAAGELTIVDDRLDDISQIITIVERVKDAGILACCALDIEGPYGEFVDALADIGVDEASEQIVGIGQGYRLMGAIKTVERKLANGTFIHAKSGLMDWCVGNVKIESTATAIRATKSNAGDAKIDPWAALMDSATVMAKNPDSAPSYEMFVV